VKAALQILGFLLKPLLALIGVKLELDGARKREQVAQDRAVAQAAAADTLGKEFRHEQEVLRTQERPVSGKKEMDDAFQSE
jgi:hypothetical protein